MKKIFHGAGEKEVSRAIINEFSRELSSAVESDCIIVGAGPSGLLAAKLLSDNGFKIVLIEKNNYLGGGFWSGGYFMNQATFRHPSQKILERLKIKYKKAKNGLYIVSAPYACSKLISACCESGVKILNLTAVEDIVLIKDRCQGVVINWAAVSYLPRPLATVDPLALEAEFVIDATGHEAFVVSRLVKRGILKIKGEAPMWIKASEDEVVSHTGLIYPGLGVCGMSVAAYFGLPRMGPTFGSMLLSGEKIYKLVKKELQK